MKIPEYLLSIFEKFCPVRIFLAEHLFLLLGQVMRVVREKVVDSLFVETEQEFSYGIHIVDPKNFVFRMLFVKGQVFMVMI